MKLKLFSTGKSAHNGFASCVCWISNEVFITSGDDRKLLFWNAQSRHHEPLKSIQLNVDTYPVSMDYALQNASTYSQLGILENASSNVGQIQNTQIVAIGTSNGKVLLFPLVSTQQQQMKKFDAHQGSVIAIKWSPDISTLATGGEDGFIKIWSKIGMLRSTLSQNDISIYCIAWSPDSNSLAYSANEGQLVIKSLSPQARSTEWLAHEGLMIALDWNLQNRNRIISSGEDGRVMIWDTNGSLIFSTNANQSSVPTSICWSPNGNYFAVSTFLSLKLYHSSGSIITIEKLSFEGVFRICWSPDSNQIAMVCANGNVIFANIIDQTFETTVWQIQKISYRTIKVCNFLTDINETLDFSSSIIRFSFSFDHLLIVTSTQCFIYSINNWISPNYFDIRTLDLVLLIVQTAKHFFLVGSNFSISIYEYNGRIIKTFKLNNMKLGGLQSDLISLNSQYIGYKDAANLTTINFVSIFGKNRIVSYQHSLEIISLKLSPESKQIDNEQVIVFIDSNQDLYSLMMRNDNIFRIFKLSSMITDFIWHSDYSILVALNETQSLIVWLYPHVAFVDPNLLQNVQLPILIDLSQQLTNGTKSSKFLNFIQNQITLIKGDNLQIHTTINPFITLLHKLKHENRWKDAIKMCNILNDFNNKDFTNSDKAQCSALFAALAVMSLEEKEFETSKIAYAAIDRIEKVLHLNSIKSIQQSDVQALELDLMRCNIDASESGFIQKGYILRAIILNLNLYRWCKALKLASQYNSKFNKLINNNKNVSLIEIVLSNRQKYLQLKSRNETLTDFLDALKNFDYIIEWKEIETNIKLMLYER